jgi:hypothetical protein
MRSRELQFGMIRDKEGIYAGLIQSQSFNRQLAICYKSEGKLLVQICSVLRIEQAKDTVMVTVYPQPEEPGSKPTTLLLDNIESIYPIHAFIQ